MMKYTKPVTGSSGWQEFESDAKIGQKGAFFKGLKSKKHIIHDIVGRKKWEITTF
ncbi:MAG: hypothetical protein JRJ66_06045 [Deltaproteobacteria bacterium]|nr:hypothetical protein [Deltaproteobacteria bacterium]